MKKPKRQSARLQTQAEEDRAAANSAKRKLNTGYLFWTVCGDRACARARGCAGADPEACFKRFWPAVPEEMKVELRAYAVGVAQKHMNQQEAMAYAASEVERWKACQAEDEREWQTFVAALRAPEPETAPPEPKPYSGPRIRTL